MAALNIPVQLISTCNTIGEIRPLWFRYENEQHEMQTIRIDEVVSCKESFHCGISYLVYVCWTMLDGFRRLVELRYYVEMHQWKLFRVLS